MIAKIKSFSMNALLWGIVAFIMLVINFAIGFAVGIIPGILTSLKAVPVDPTYVMTFWDYTMVTVLYALIIGITVGLIMTVIEFVFLIGETWKTEKTLNVWKMMEKELEKDPCESGLTHAEVDDDN